MAETPNKLSDWEYHALQAMKELSLVEDHLIGARNTSTGATVFQEILGKVREIRKQVENDVLNDKES